MKILGLIIALVLVASVGVYAREDIDPVVNGLNMPVDGKLEAKGSVYESVMQDVDREDRMERCISKMQRAYPEKAARAEDACKRMYAGYDLKVQARNLLRERFSLTESQAERLSMVKQERREKIESLNEERVKKLADLEVRNVEKISALSRERIEKIADLDDEMLEKFSLISKGRMEYYAGLSEEDLEVELNKAVKKKVKTENAGKIRSISEEKRKQAENNFRKARTDFGEHKENYERYRNEFNDLVKTEREICAEEGDACDEVKEESLKKAKMFLEELGKQQLNYIEQMEERVRSSEAFSQADAEDLLEDLEESKGKVERSLQFLETAETKAEVKEAAGTLLRNWERIKIKVRDSREEIVYRESKKYVSRIDALEAKMGRMLQRMEEAEIDVSEYEDELDAISDKVAEAQEKLDEARNKFEEFRNSEDHEENLELLEEAKVLFNEGHLMLKEAHAELMALANTIFDEQEEDFEEEEDEVEIIVINDPKLPKAPSLEELEVHAE